MEETMEASSFDSTSSDSDDDCAPRVGPDYQVGTIPPCTHNFFTENDNAAMDEEQEAFAVGLPVQVTTIRMTSDQKQEFNRGGTPEQNGCDERDETGDGKRKGKKKRKGNWMTFRRMRAKNLCDLEVIVPGDSFHPWEECEEAGFVLGLYLFGKDFNALKRFLETRRITDLQHYYYSIFYGTPAYKRWVAARNSCSKRIVNGRHILVGWRQEELLRRLLPELEECSRPELFEAMAGFNKGEISFEKYVSRLKAITGLELLVESISLGCGKRDLTMGSVDSVQTTKKFELPAGKSFSDYTASEMFRALSGGCRLSKTKAQDLFWEGVWPRLLAKGWSSEQSGKGPLIVYMIPGIKRYSKRLMKGRDYFDSISEVLNHLAGDPTLLELPELDNELLAKSQTEATNKLQKGENSNGVMNSPSSDRKRRPTLWLNKARSLPFTADEEDDDEKKKKKKKLDEPSDKPVLASKTNGQDGASVVRGLHVEAQVEEVECRGGGDVGDNNSSEPTCDRGSDEAAGLSTARWGGAGGEVVTRKRSFAVLAGDVVGGVSVIAAAQHGARKGLVLSSMIKQYLGNGKSVRLYGPLAQLTRARELFIEGFQRALQRNRKGMVSLNLNLNLNFLVGERGKCQVVEVTAQQPSAALLLPVETKKKARLSENAKDEAIQASSVPRLSSSCERKVVSCRDCGASAEDSSHKCCGRLEA